MNSSVVLEVANATLAGKISFPDVVAKLLAEGVEYYHVDYAGLTKSFYDADGARVVTPIPYEALPPIAPAFDTTALKAAILASQTQGQSYRDFTIRAITAGVQSYYAFLHWQRVTYLGRDGEQHTEWFPGAKR